MNSTAFHQLSYGVYLCTAWDEGRPTGCVANSAMQITATPATVAISINHLNYTNECIKKTGYFAVCVLAEDVDPLLIGKFGFSSGRDTDKFDGVKYSVRGKMPVVDDCCAYFSCKVVSVMETETHTVFLGEVMDADVPKKGKPMTYAYYHQVVKGKTAKNAPTYIEEEKTTNEAKYVCGICGYTYDGDIPFEELPDDWRCPVCGQPKSVFEKK